MPVAAPALSCAELILLFHGDADTAPCHNPELVAAICAQLEPEPTTRIGLVRALYRVDMVPDWLAFTYEADAIERGLDLFRARRKEARE